MRYTILFIITLVFVSGFIAYFGDFLGRKMGKKRLTLLGLRPRHTAIMVTTITGMLIAILTLATITGISTSIREVLIAGEQKITQNKQLTKDNKALTDTNQRLRAKEQKFRKDYEEAKKARDAAANKVSDLTKLIALNIKELNDLKGKKNATEAQLAAKVRMLQSLEKELRGMQKVLAQTDEKLHDAQEKLAAAEKELANSFRIAEEQRRTIDSQQKAMDEINQQIEDQRAVLVKLGQENIMWINGIARLKTQDVVLKQGQEILRRVVSQDQSFYSIRSDILAILDEANKKAIESGAAAGKNERAVMLVPPTPDSSEQECISTVAELISRSATPVMVQVIVFSNTVKGETAPVHLQLFRNDLAFSKGKTLAVGKIDGRQTEGRILLSVVNFLRNDVRKAADDAGVVPVASPEPEIQGEQLDELMDLVSKIKQINALVRVRVSAEKDIYAAGPLNLKNLEFAISTHIASASSSSK